MDSVVEQYRFRKVFEFRSPNASCIHSEFQAGDLVPIFMVEFKLSRAIMFVAVQVVLICSGETVWSQERPMPSATIAVPPTAASGIVPNSVATIWDDTWGDNTGWPANMPDFKRFRRKQKAQVLNINRLNIAQFNQQNVWIEVEEQGNGKPCSPSINQAVNTGVEVGHTKSYFLRNDDTWVVGNSTKDFLANGGGSTQPHANTKAFNTRCFGVGVSTYKNVQLANSGYNTVYRQDPDEFIIVKPDHYYRYHPWVNQVNFDVDKFKGVFGEVYFRLVKLDPRGPDDRHLARFVVQMGSDSYCTGCGGWLTGQSVSKWKKATNDWQPLSVLSGNDTGSKDASDHFTLSYLQDNPPPFRTEP